MSDKKIPKIYQMNDCDTMIAYSKREAVDYYFAEIDPGDTKEEIALECERMTDLSNEFWWNCFSPKDLWDRAMKLGWDEKLTIEKQEGDPAYKVSFKYVLENFLDKLEIPGIICSTEY